MGDAPEALRFNKVSCRYSSRDPRALDQVDLVVRPGERVALVGGNGHGKSTLIKVALGMLPVEDGEARVLGERPGWGRHVERLAYIGNPSRNDGDSALPTDVAAGWLMDRQADLFAAAGRDLPFADELARHLGLADPAVRAKRVGQLSDGWRMRLQTYLALAKGPRLLLADEPTAGCDPESRRVQLAAVRAQAEATALSVLWVTHHFEELADLDARVVQVLHGRVLDCPHGGWDWELVRDGLPNGLAGQSVAEGLAALHAALADPAVSRVEFRGRRRP